jgi:hypothetical protein
MTTAVIHAPCVNLETSTMGRRDRCGACTDGIDDQVTRPSGLTAPLPVPHHPELRHREGQKRADCERDEVVGDAAKHDEQAACRTAACVTSLQSAGARTLPMCVPQRAALSSGAFVVS